MSTGLLCSEWGGSSRAGTGVPGTCLHKLTYFRDHHSHALSACTTVDAVNTQANKGKPLPRPSYAGPTQAASLPTHWSPRANTYHHVERRVQVTRWREGLCSHRAPNPRCRYGNVCCFCLVLVIVVIIVETIQWIST